MTNRSPSNNEPNPDERRRLRRLLIWGGIGLGVVSLGVWASATWFIRNKLAPIIASQLENTLQRPVKVGQIEPFTFTEPTTIKVGASAIPPTDTNPNTASVEGIEIRLLVFPLLLRQTVNVDVDLIDPRVYLEEDQQGNWIRTKLKAAEGEPPIELKFGKINLNVENADVDLQPYAQDNKAELISLTVDQLNVNLRDNNQKVGGNLDAELAQGGSLKIQAQGNLEQETVQAKVKANQINLEQLSGFLKDEGVTFETGEITANLDARLQAGYQPASVRGTVDLNQIQANLASLKKPLRPVDGQIRFGGKQLRIDQLTGGLGEVGAEINGTVTATPDFDPLKTQLNLDVNLQPTQISTLLETAESFQDKPITLPVDVSGAVKADVNVVGTVAEPVIAGVIATTEPTQVDVLQLNQIETEFTATTQISDDFQLDADPVIGIKRLEVNPSVGGSITGKGDVQLTGLKALLAQPATDQKKDEEQASALNPEIELNLAVNQLPADELIQAYGVSPQVRLGSLSAEAEVSGNLEALEADASFRLPTAAFPVFGTAQWAENQLNSTVQIAEGTVEVTAAQEEQNFTARVDAENLALTPLVALGLPFAGLPEAVQAQVANTDLADSRLNLQANVAGALDNLNPNAINGNSDIQVSLGDRNINADVELSQGTVKADFQTDALPLNQLRDLGLPFAGLDSQTAAKLGTLDFQDGTVITTGTATSNPSNLENIIAKIDTTVNFGNLGGIVEAETQLNQGAFQADINTTSIPIKPWVGLGLPLANLPPETAQTIESLNLEAGTLQAQGNVIGNLNNITDVSGTAKTQINLGNLGGLINANGELNQGQFQANIQTDSIAIQPLVNAGVSVANLSPSLEREIRALDLRNGVLQGQGTVSGNIANLNRTAITATADGFVDLGNQGGLVKATGTVEGGQWQTQVEGDRIALTRFSQLVESQTRDVAPSLLTQAQNLPLLRGLLDTELQATGSLFNLSPAGIRGMGNLNLTEVPILRQPFEAIAGWDGEQIKIEKAETPQFGTAGTIALELQGNGVPQLGNLNLDLRVSQFDFQSPLAQTLLATLPQEIMADEGKTITGIVSFDGKVTGSLPRLNLTGDINLEQFALRGLQFDPILAGGINAQLGEGVNLALAGQQDKIELVLDEQYLPVSFLVQRGEIIAKGTPQGNDLKVDVQQFPLAVLGIAPLAAQGLGSLQGTTFADLIVSDLSTLDPNRIDVVGTIGIENPALGHLKAKQFNIDLRLKDGDADFSNGVLQLAKLEDGEILPGETEVRISANADVQDMLVDQQSGVPLFFQPEAELNPDAPSQFDIRIEIPQGELQEVLTTLQWYQLEDISRGIQPLDDYSAADVETVAVGFPQDQSVTLKQQLRRFAEIKALIQQAEVEAQNGNPLPPLSEVAGAFTGLITAQGALTAGVIADATLNNQGDWKWGKLTADRFNLKAELKDNVLRVEPIQLKAEQTLYDFRGQLDLATQQQSGQFRVKDISLAAIEEYYDIPGVDLEGQFRMRAFISGSLKNPQASGDFNLLDGVINNETIEEAKGSFNYNQARLRLGGDFFVTETANNPIVYKASIPYRLPFAEVKPSSPELSAELNVQDEGFKIINVLNPEVDWIEGGELLTLELKGKLPQKENGEIDFENVEIRPEGVLKLENAVLKAKSVEESIVGLTGTATFINDQIRVKEITGQIQGEQGTGEFLLKGVLPLFPEDILESEDPDFKNPLELTLEDLKLNVDRLYQGQVGGNFVVTGAALKPNIGGNVAISKAVVTIPGGGGGNGAGGGGLPELPIEIGLNNFQIELGEKVRIQSAPVGQLFDAPILDIGVQGDIVVNGALTALDSIRPEGEVTLTGGAIDLYTNRFSLDNGYAQKAIFKPEQGLDPNLDVRLVTKVTETNRAVSPPSAIFPEEQNTPSPARLGTVRTIRVIATAKGPASRLNDIVELKSSPPRSQTQLIALLGGSVIDGVTGDSTLLLANLASAGFFGKIQRTVTEATGLNEFRLYPARLEDNSSSGASALGLGLEVGLDVTNNVSATVTRVLAAGQPTRLGVNYRVNDNLLLRGETDFQDSSAIRFEYEIQF